MFRNNSIRLKDFDYANNGGYFVTICTQNNLNLFGEIIEGKMVLNEVGEIIEKWWLWLESQYFYVQLDSFVIMPNHLHGVIIINTDEKGVSRNAPTKKVVTENSSSGLHITNKIGTGNCSSGSHITNKVVTENCRGGSRTAQKIKPLGQIIGAFKTVSTKQVNVFKKTQIKLWQRGYYDHVIRNENELSNIRKYTQNNPLKWHLDIENREINKKIDLLNYYNNIFRIM